MTSISQADGDRARTSERFDVSSAPETADEVDRPARDLDPIADRDELKSRYYNLMQELRVLLPGVQVLVAFLLTVPFASHFDELDPRARALFGTSVVSGALAVIVFMTPIALHRFGDRRDRVQRLQLSIKLAQCGLILFGIALTAAVLVVVTYVFAPIASAILVALVLVPMVGLWIVLPLRTRRDHHR